MFDVFDFEYLVGVVEFDFVVGWVGWGDCCNFVVGKFVFGEDVEYFMVDIFCCVDDDYLIIYFIWFLEKEKVGFCVFVGVGFFGLFGGLLLLVSFCLILVGFVGFNCCFVFGNMCVFVGVVM